MAAVDRLMHHAKILKMNVDSYRRRGALTARPQRSETSSTQWKSSTAPLKIVDAKRSE